MGESSPGRLFAQIPYCTGQSPIESKRIHFTGFTTGLRPFLLVLSTFSLARSRLTQGVKDSGKASVGGVFRFADRTFPESTLLTLPVA
jgi:hypothetical protein